MKKALCALLLTACLLTCNQDSLLEVPLRVQTFDATKLGFCQGNIIDLYSFRNLLIVKTFDREERKHCFQKMDIETQETDFIFATDEKIMDTALDQDGNIYLATEENGIIVFSQTGTEIAHYTTANSCVPNNRVTAVTVDENNHLYFGSTKLNDAGLERAYYTGSGLIKMDQQNLNCQTWKRDSLANSIPGNIIIDIAVKDNDLWVSTFQRMSSNFSNNIDDFGGGLGYLTDNQWAIFDQNNTPELISYRMLNLQIGIEKDVFFESLQLTDVPQALNEHSTLLQIDQDGQVEDIGSNTHLNIKHIATEDQSGNKVVYGYYALPMEDQSFYDSRHFFYRIMDGGNRTVFSESVLDGMRAIVLDQNGVIWLGGGTHLQAVTLF